MFKPYSLLVLLLLLVFLLSACTGTSASRRSTSAVKVNDTAVGTLYAELDQGTKRYESGLALANQGETKRAQNEIKRALDDLRATAARCGRLPGCDDNRFFSAFDRLLRLHADGFANQDAADTVSDTPEATPEEVESSPVVANLPEVGRAVTLLKGRELADMITLNGAVKAGLEQWLTQYRPNLMDAYENYQYMRYQMWPEYQKAELPEALLFGFLAKESGGKVHAVSRSGASGPLQFMYATGLRFGLSTVNGFDQRFDPKMAAQANVAYVNEQLRIFNNNLELVLGAYNGGEGRMQRLATRTGNASFWDPKLYSELSPETRDYVPMVLAAAWLFMHPERYHLEFPKIDGRPGSITLKESMSLAELTVCLGQNGNMHGGWFRTLRNLNAALDSQQRQPVGTSITVPSQLEAVYASSCVSGPWVALAGDLHSAIVPVVAQTSTSPPVRARSASRTYVVRKGDNLGAIARKAGCSSSEQVARANGLRPPHYALRAGQSLELPGVCVAR